MQPFQEQQAPHPVYLRVQKPEIGSGYILSLLDVDGNEGPGGLALESKINPVGCALRTRITGQVLE